MIILLMYILILTVITECQNQNENFNNLNDLPDSVLDLIQQIQNVNNQIIDQEQIVENISEFRKNYIYSYFNPDFDPQKDYSNPQQYEQPDIYGETEEYIKEQNLIKSLKEKFKLKVENHRIKEIKYISLKQGKSSDPLNQYLLVAITEDSYVLLLDLKGNIQDIYNPGHIIYKWTYLNQGEENLLTTLGYDWQIKNHQINITMSENMVEVPQKPKIIQQRKAGQVINIEEPQPPILKKQIQIQGTLEFENDFNLLDQDFFSNKTNIKLNRFRKTDNETDTPELTEEQILQQRLELIPFDIENPDSSDHYISSFEGYYSKYNKIFYLGDNLGQVHAFYKNGTRHGKGLLSREPIISIQKHYPQPMYITKSQIGFFNSNNLQITNPQCEQSIEEVVLVEKESQHSQTFFVIQKNLEILIYETKNQKQQCQVIFKLNGMDQSIFTNDQNPNDFNVQVFANDLIIYNKYTKEAKMLNITDYKNKPTDLLDDTGYYLNGLHHSLSLKKQQELNSIQNQNQQQNYLYTTQKHSSNIAYITYVQTSGNDTFVLMYELFIPSPGFSFNIFENVRFPMILIAVFVLFLIKFWKKDKKDDFDGSDQFSKEKIDKLISDFSKSEGGKK